MTGGGARAAYQVGVLRYICKHFKDFHPPILTGVSAGALNAVHLASHQGSFADAVEHLAGIWTGLNADKVFRTDSRYFLANFLRWGSSLILGGRRIGQGRRSLLDNDPLRRLLEKNLGTLQGSPSPVFRRTSSTAGCACSASPLRTTAPECLSPGSRDTSVNIGGGPDGAVKMRTSPSST